MFRPAHTQAFATMMLVYSGLGLRIMVDKNVIEC
jgi:hypothetical protein